MTARGCLPLLAACVAAWLAAATPGARADELQDIGELFRQGDHAQALERVNSFLATQPADAKARFLKGMILSGQGRSEDAIQVFRSLTEDYPELPEPHNNLAVLYAAQGRYDEARTSLEGAIRADPRYAVAYENLGDIYLKLASLSYEKGAQLHNASAGTKLQRVQRILTEHAPGKAATP